MEIEIAIDRSPDIDQLVLLFQQAGWLDKLDKSRIKSMIDSSTIIATAWHDAEMIGFARCLTDYTFNGQINNVVVDENYRRQGVGRLLINIILESSEQVTYVVRADPENIAFYRNLGFEDSNFVLIHKRTK